MENIKSVIDIHNKDLITEMKTQVVNCHCTNYPDFLHYNQEQILNIMYKSKITSNLQNFHGKIYHGTSKGKLKQRYENHKKSLNHKQHRTDTGRNFERILEA